MVSPGMVAGDGGGGRSPTAWSPLSHHLSLPWTRTAAYPGGLSAPQGLSRGVLSHLGGPGRAAEIWRWLPPFQVKAGDPLLSPSSIPVSLHLSLFPSLSPSLLQWNICYIRTYSTKWWQRRKQTWPFIHCWWKYKTAQALWGKAWQFLIKLKHEDFPGGPVVKTPCFQCREHRFDLWSRKFQMPCGAAKK